MVDLSFLVKYHHRCAGDGLGHRVDAEDGIRLHEMVIFDIRHAEGLQVRYFAAPGHQGEDASQLVFIYISLHNQINTAESVAGKPDALRLNDVHGLFPYLQ